MKTSIRIHACQWLDYPSKRTVQIGPVFFSRHFPGVSGWSIDILTARAGTWFPACRAIGNGWKRCGFLWALCSRWKCVAIHFGPAFFTIALCRESYARQIEALEMGARNNMENSIARTSTRE